MMIGTWIAGAIVGMVAVIATLLYIANRLDADDDPDDPDESFEPGRIREDLINTINLLDAYETPFYSAIGDDTAKNRKDT